MLLSTVHYPLLVASNLRSAFMLLRLAIKYPLILSGLQDTNKRGPTETQTSTPAPGCRGGHVHVTVNQPCMLQPMWKQAILICKAAADPCLLPLPPFCSGRAVHAQESFTAETAATASTETLDLRRGEGQQGHTSNATLRQIFQSVFLGGAPQETGKVL